MDIEMSEGSLSMALKCAWALDHSLRLDEIIEGMDESENMPATQWAIEQEHMAQCLEAQVIAYASFVYLLCLDAPCHADVFTCACL